MALTRTTMPIVVDLFERAPVELVPFTQVGSRKGRTHFQAAVDVVLEKLGVSEYATATGPISDYLKQAANSANPRTPGLSGPKVVPNFSNTDVDMFRTEVAQILPSDALDLATSFIGALHATWSTPEGIPNGGKFNQEIEGKITEYNLVRLIRMYAAGEIATTKSKLANDFGALEKSNRESAVKLSADLNARAQREMAEAVSRISNVEQLASETQVAYEAKLRKYNSESEDIRSGLAQFDEKLKQQTEDLDSWKVRVQQAATELLKLKNTQEMWDELAKRATNDASLSLATLAALIIVPIALVLIFPGFFGSLLHSLLGLAAGPISSPPTAAEVTAFAISRVVILSLPIVVYFWVIRLVVRYWTRSLLLQDDARARDTMLKTYRQLIEDRGATADADRAIVLAAIFRPIPGHGNDTDPPKLAEMFSLPRA